MGSSIRSILVVLRRPSEAARALLAGLFALFTLSPSPLRALPIDQRLKNVGIDQRLEAQVPADLAFHDESGHTVRLGDYFGKRPIILTLVYFRCPMLCTLTLNDLAHTMQQLPSAPGKQFEVITVSFDPRETPTLASAKKHQYISSLGNPQAADGWHFLTGDAQSIDRLTKAVGFRYFFDNTNQLFVHPTGVIVLSPAGKISRYFFGVQYDPKDLRLALIDAANGKVHSLSDAILVLCCQLDTSTGRYTLAVSRLLRIFGGAMILLMLGGVLWLKHREHQAPPG